MRPFKSRGPVLTDRGRVLLATVITAVMALAVAGAAVDASPDGEGDPLPPHSIRSR